MKRFPFVSVLWNTTNLLLALSLAAFLYCLLWDHYTRSYVQGFADAVVPVEAVPEEKIEAILNWMRHGPTRHSGQEASNPRDPLDTLQSAELLRVCGSATNAFINLSVRSGVPARRLLLLDENRLAKHVVAEVRLHERWVVVDPLYRVILRAPDGRSLAKEELRNPEIWKEATKDIPGYSPLYTYEKTSHVRLAKIPLLGRPIRRTLDRLTPGWDSWPTWSLILERASLFYAVLTGMLSGFLLCARFAVASYAERKLGAVRLRLRDRMKSAFHALLSQG